MLRTMLGLLIGIALVAGIYAYTESDGSPVTRVETFDAPVEVVSVQQIGTPPDVVAIQITVRSTVQYKLMGEVWYEVLRRGALFSFYQASRIAFGPLDPLEEATFTFDDLDWDQSRPFRIRPWVREALPVYEPRSQNITTDNNVVTLRQATYEIQLTNPQLSDVNLLDGTARLNITMAMINRDSRDHAYRALVDVRPVDDPKNVIFRSDFHVFDASTGQQASVMFDEEIVLTPGVSHTVSLWVQIEDSRDSFQHLVQINLPRTIMIGTGTGS